MKVLIPMVLIFLARTAIAETIILELNDKKYGKASVPIEFDMPEKRIKTPVPLVILQHGSTQDASDIFGGSVDTDVHQYRLAKFALLNGFPVAVVDAFYKKGLRPGDKRKFPNAHSYAMQRFEII